MTSIMVITLFVLFLVNLLAATKFGRIAEMKGYLLRDYFWWCFLAGIIGWLMVIALPDRGDTHTNETISRNELPDL